MTAEPAQPVRAQSVSGIGIGVGIVVGILAALACVVLVIALFR